MANIPADNGVKCNHCGDSCGLQLNIHFCKACMSVMCPDCSETYDKIRNPFSLQAENVERPFYEEKNCYDLIYDEKSSPRVQMEPKQNKTKKMVYEHQASVSNKLVHLIKQSVKGDVRLYQNMCGLKSAILAYYAVPITGKNKVMKLTKYFYEEYVKGSGLKPLATFIKQNPKIKELFEQLEYLCCLELNGRIMVNICKKNRQDAQLNFILGK